MEKIDIFLWGFIIVLLIIYPTTNEKENYEISERNMKQQEIIDYCDNKNLTETAYCLRDQIKTFYFYNVTDSYTLSFEEIKRRGGDCKSYTYLYGEFVKDYNFNFTSIINPGVFDVKSGHMYGLLWDDNQYCILDQLNIVCKERDSML